MFFTDCRKGNKFHSLRLSEGDEWRGNSLVWVDRHAYVLTAAQPLPEGSALV